MGRWMRTSAPNTPSLSNLRRPQQTSEIDQKLGVGGVRQDRVEEVVEMWDSGGGDCGRVVGLYTQR